MSDLNTTNISTTNTAAVNYNISSKMSTKERPFIPQSCVPWSAVGDLSQAAANQPKQD